HAATRIALLRADDRAHVVAELLVLRITGRGAREDPVGDVRLAPQEREVRVIFRRAGPTLPREPVAVGDLAPLHPSSAQAEAGVPPDRRTDGTQSGLGFGELIHRPIDPARGPI